MHASPEHRVEIHRLARERVKAGRPVWEHTIDLRGVFHAELPFTEWRDKVVSVVKASNWVKDAEEYSDLAEAVEELADSEDMAEFNLVWSAIYDLADYDRVWITTR